MGKMPYIAVALSLQASVLPGCGLGLADRSCEEQLAVAGRLAEDPAFTVVDVNANVISRYKTTPCEENSGGSLITAGLHYEGTNPITADDLWALGRKAASTGEWEMIAEMRPSDPGMGGNAHACYQATSTNGVHRYLRLHTVAATTTPRAAAETFSAMYITVSQSESAVEVCATAR